MIRAEHFKQGPIHPTSIFERLSPGTTASSTCTTSSTALRRLAYAVDDAFFDMPEPGYLGSIRPQLAELDPDAVNSAMRRHWQTGNMYVVFVTSDAEALKALLLSGEPTPIAYAGQQSAELLAEDEEIAAWPIPVREEDITIMDIMEVFERGS